MPEEKPLQSCLRVRPRIGLIMRGLGYSYQDFILSGLHESCQKLGFDALCLIGGVLSKPDPRSTVYSVISAADVDGVIIATGSMGGGEHTPAFQDLFRRFSSIPCCSIAFEQPGVSSVNVDNSSGAFAATKHLIVRHRRKRLAFLAGVGAESEARFEGFRQAHEDCGLAFDSSLYIEGNYSPESGVAAVAQFGMPIQPLVDAVVAANDWMAMGAIEEAERRGFTIPEQIAIVGFDDSDHSRFTTPPLTTIRQPIADLARAAVQNIAAQLAGHAVPQSTKLPTELVIRHSCGCVHRAMLPEGPTESSASAIGEVMSAHRLSLEQALRNDAPAAVCHLEFNWCDELLNGLFTDLDSGSGAFCKVLDRCLKQTASLGSVSSWHSAISALRGAAIRTGIADVRDWFRFESIVEEAHVLIGSHAERVQGRRRIAQEVQTHTLEALGNAVRTALDFDALSHILCEHMSSVGLEQCWVTLTPEEIKPDAPSRLIVACDTQSVSPVQLLPTYPTGQILPDSQLRRCPSTYVIQSMVFGGATLGLCILPHTSCDGAIYNQVTAPVTASVKAALLLKAVVDEVKRREALERERLEHEMAIAQRIQTAIFPKDLRVVGLELSASMDPATEVGGDYFDVLPTTDGCWLGIGDVAGHGLPTGLVALMIQSIVAGITQHGANAAPAQIWSDMNSVLYDNVRTRLRQDEHATLSLMRYWSDGRLQYAGAHEDMILLRASAEQAALIPSIGVWSGITKQLPPQATQQEELRLEPGDLLLLYSDGVTEAKDAGRQLFGVQRLCRALESNRYQPVEAIRLAILSQVKGWMHKQDDDMTLVVARYSGSL